MDTKQQYFQHIKDGLEYLKDFELREAATRAAGRNVEAALQAGNDHPVYRMIHFGANRGELSNSNFSISASKSTAENVRDFEDFLSQNFDSLDDAAIWFGMNYKLQYFYKFDGAKANANHYLRPFEFVQLLHYGVTGEYTPDEETRSAYSEALPSADAFDYVELPAPLEGMQLKRYKNQNYRVKGYPEDAAEKLRAAMQTYQDYRRRRF